MEFDKRFGGGGEEVKDNEWSDFKDIDLAKEFIISKGVKDIDMGKSNISHSNAVAKALNVVPKSAIPEVICDKKLYESISGLKIKRKSEEWLGISVDMNLFDRKQNDFIGKIW